MPYSDTTVQECITSEFLVNPNIWHVNVPLVVYANVEMHESNRVFQQFRVHGKPYLLAKKVRGRPSHTRSPRRVPRHPRSGEAIEAGPLSTPTQEPTPMVAPSPVSLTTRIKPSLEENSFLTSKSLESNEELAWPGLLCSSFANSNPFYADRSTLCMYVGGENHNGNFLTNGEPLHNYVVGFSSVLPF
ncbi:hypothetical protein J1N35_043303 [Gossypium stocksii]|uniref:Uncharacterized protein n=1 Tax=Gossypium stocksii TaxID=47602 RepID=A0A9D3ZEW1_9ROSI|nr:hypothetical protein J1N35_043303 [Gossypium stocksii]